MYRVPINVIAMADKIGPAVDPALWMEVNTALPEDNSSTVTLEPIKAKDRGKIGLIPTPETKAKNGVLTKWYDSDFKL